MTHPFESFTQRSRTIFGQARLTYWDDGPISAEVKGLYDGLERPVAVAVVGGTPDDRAALAKVVDRAGSGLVTVVAAAAEAVVQLVGDGTGLTTPREWTLGVLLAGTDSEAAAVDVHPRALITVDLRANPTDLSGLRAELDSLAADVVTTRHVVALWGLRKLLKAAPRKGADDICEAIDDVETEGPEPRELHAVMTLRSGGADELGAADRTDAMAVLGAARTRQQGLAPGGATVTTDDLARWRTVASNPALSRASRDLATTVGRACERLLAGPD